MIGGGDAELCCGGENGDAELCCGGITAAQVKVKWCWLREDSSSLGEGNAQTGIIQPLPPPHYTPYSETCAFSFKL
jgi:hypothetical protein